MLKVCDVSNLKSGEYIQIVEGKTQKQNILMINKSVYKTIRFYLDRLQPEQDTFLFASKKTKRPITIQRVNLIIKRFAREINLTGNYGAHTLRKTFGYIQRTEFGVGFEVLAKRFNHSNPAITMRYLGLTSKEVNDALMNEI